MLQKSLSKYKVPIDYLHDSKKNICVKKDTVYINDLLKLIIDSNTTVSKINYTLIPLIFFNYEETNLLVKLGQSSIKPKYNDFFINSFLTETQRSGCFISKNQLPKNNQYILEISIDSCKTESIYQMKSTLIFLLIAFSSRSREIGFPSTTILNANLILRKDDKILLKKNYNIERQQPFIISNVKNTDQLRSDFTTNMVESLSLTTKQCIENIVSDLNEYFLFTK
jgi:hypothetical protein